MKTKKKVLIAVCCVLAFLLIGGGVAYCFLPHPLNYPIGSIEAVGSAVQVLEKTEDRVTVKKAGGGDFKILMFTDLHLDGKNKTSKVTVSHLVENIQREKPDLVILGGDNVTSGINRTRAAQLGMLFEQLGVYWAGVLGNHEGDNRFSISREAMMDVFTSYEHCLMLKGTADVTGDCNYELRILNEDGSLQQAFFFLDTFDMVSDDRKPQYGFSAEDKVTDGVRPDQVAWYTKRANELKAEFGDCRSVMVIHIPLPQVKEAAETGGFLYGDKRENVCCTGFEPGLFKAVKTAGVTQSVFCGHDHLNNFGAMYDGILLSYIEPSGYGSYTTASRLGYEEKDWLQGYTRLVIHPDGSMETPAQIRNSALEN